MFSLMLICDQDVYTCIYSWHFTKTSVRALKMNAVARAQLAFQMLTLFAKYLHYQNQYSNTGRRSKCRALITQIVRAFGLNPKIGGSGPTQVEAFSVSKNTFTRTSVRVSKMNAVARAQLTFKMLTLLKKYSWNFVRRNELGVELQYRISVQNACLSIIVKSFWIFEQCTLF